MAKAAPMILDMTNVKEGGPSFNKRRVPEGDYLAKVTKVEDAPVKNGDNKGASQWCFTITLVDKANAVYPYYCQHAENQLWKIRNLLVAAGITVPRKRVRIDPDKLVGKTIAVTLQDGEYEGKEQSEIAAIFTPAEMNGGAEDDDVEDDDEEEEEPTPAPKAKRRAAPEPEPEEEDEDEAEEEEEEEEPEPAPVKRKRKVAPPVVEDEDEEEEEDDEEDEEEEPAPRKKVAKKVAAPARRTKRQVTDEELEELDIDDI